MKLKQTYIGQVVPNRPDLGQARVSRTKRGWETLLLNNAYVIMGRSKMTSLTPNLSYYPHFHIFY